MLRKPYFPEKRVAVNWTIFNTCEAVRIAAILLQPIMPGKAGRLLDELKVRPERRTLAFAKRGLDDDYGVSDDGAPGAHIEPWDTVFPPVPGGRLSDEEVKDELYNVKTPSERKNLSRIAGQITRERRDGQQAAAEYMADMAAKKAEKAPVQPRPELPSSPSDK